jgi:hypothetical protein
MSERGGKMVRRSCIPNLIVVALVLTVARVSMADRPPPDKEVQRLFDEGNALLQARDYAGALQRYQAAYERYPHAKLLLNMGTALYGLGRNTEALETYEKYQRHPEADPARKKEVAGMVKELAARVVTVEIDASEPDARVTVDGRPLEKVPASVRLDPGVHVVAAKKDGFRHAEETVSLKAAQSRSVRLVLAAANSPTASDAPPTATPPPSSAPSPAAAPAPPSSAASASIVRGAEPAAAPFRKGFELGLHAGLGLPFGDLEEGNSVRIYAALVAPVMIEGHVRLTPGWSLGVNSHWARFVVNGSTECCEGEIFGFGIGSRYRFSSGSRFKPWAGAGVSYEWFQARGNRDQTFSGLKAQVDLGAYVFTAGRVAAGPYLSASHGAVGGWAGVGLRAGFAIWP